MFAVGEQLLAGKPESDILPDALGFFAHKTKAVGLAVDSSYPSLMAAAWRLETLKPQIEALNPPLTPKRKRRLK